jgi:hypothetical protein
LILGVVVGGSALASAGLLARSHPIGPLAAALAGVVQVGWIVGEVLIVGSEPGIMRDLQFTFFAVGALLAAICLDLARRQGGDAARLAS